MPSDGGGELGLLLTAVPHPSLERARKREVELSTLAREQIVVDDLAQEGVSELEAPVVAGDEDVLGDGFPEGFLKVGELDPLELGDQLLLEPAADRDPAGGALGIRGEPLDPEHERVTEALGEGAPAVEPSGHELLGVERVALAAVVQPVNQSVSGSLAQDVGEDLDDLGAAERRELDPAHVLEAGELGEQGRTGWRR